MDNASNRRPTAPAPAPAATGDGSARNQNWYCLHYTPEAPAGLPPIIQADQVLRYTDDTATWLVALWVPVTNGDYDEAAATILRVRAAHVANLTRHHDMGQAASGAFGRTPPTREPKHPATAPEAPAR